MEEDEEKMLVLAFPGHLSYLLMGVLLELRCEPGPLELDCGTAWSLLPLQFCKFPGKHF